MTEIKTARLSLRPISDGDAERVTDILTNPEVGMTFMVPDYKSRDDALKTFHALKTLSDSADRFVRGVFLGDELVGFINDVGISGTEIELGYVISPAHKNSGYATEALAAAIDALFKIGYTTVKAAAFEENAASLRVMEKCGMAETGLIETVEYRGKPRRCICREIRKQ